MKKNLKIVISLVLMFSVSFSLISTASLESFEINTTETKITENVNPMVFLGDANDNAVKEAFSSFIASIHQGYTLTSDLKTLMDYDGPIVIFAHGEPYGLFLNGQLTSWNQMAILLSTSHAIRVLLMTCYSNSIVPYLSKSVSLKTVSINGLVDAKVSGYISGLYLDKSPNVVSSITNSFNLLNVIVKRIEAIEQSIIVPNYLCISPSSISFKVSQSNSNYGFGWPYHRENLLWIGVGANLVDLYNGEGWGSLLVTLVGAAITAPLSVGMSIIFAGYLFALSHSINTSCGTVEFALGMVIVHLGLPATYFEFWSYWWGGNTYPHVNAIFAGSNVDVYAEYVYVGNYLAWIWGWDNWVHPNL